MVHARATILAPLKGRAAAGSGEAPGARGFMPRQPTLSVRRENAPHDWRSMTHAARTQSTMRSMTPPATARRRASLAAALALIALIAAAVIWWLPSRTPVPAPDTELALLDGTTRSIATARGRPLLLAFWSLTCAPCLEELPDLVRLYEQWRPRGLEMIAVTMPYDPPLGVQEFARTRALPYPVAVDVQGTAMRAWGVAYVPTAFLIDAEGRVVYQQTGKLDIPRVQRLLEELLPREHS
jgi:peroxiredoxin